MRWHHCARRCAVRGPSVSEGPPRLTRAAGEKRLRGSKRPDNANACKVLGGPPTWRDRRRRAAASKQPCLYVCRTEKKRKTTHWLHSIRAIYVDAAGKKDEARPSQA